MEDLYDCIEKRIDKDDKIKYLMKHTWKCYVLHDFNQDQIKYSHQNVNEFLFLVVRLAFIGWSISLAQNVRELSSGQRKYLNEVQRKSW